MKIRLDQLVRPGTGPLAGQVKLQTGKTKNKLNYSNQLQTYHMLIQKTPNFPVQSFYQHFQFGQNRERKK